VNRKRTHGLIRETCITLFSFQTVIYHKENTETLLEVNKDVGLEINAQKTKYMIMSRHQN
jgi:hypothetical protein